GNCPGGPENRSSNGSSIATSPGATETISMAYSRTNASAARKDFSSVRLSPVCASVMAITPHLNASRDSALSQRCFWRLDLQCAGERFCDVVDRPAAALDPGQDQRALDRGDRERRQASRIGF